MSDYNRKLDECIENLFGKHGLTTKSVLNSVGKILRETCEGKKFAIWGSGDHTVQLHKIFSLEMSSAEFILDNDKNMCGKRFLGFDVKYPEKSDIEKLDVIFISSYSCADVIEEQIRAMNVNVETVHIYKKLREIGIKLKAAFYSDTSVYIDLYNLYEKFEKSNNSDVLEEMILLYLQIRDFNNAKYYIKIYIKNDLKKCESMKKLLVAINNIEKEVEEEIRRIKSNNIFIFYWDAIRAKDVFENENENKMIYVNELLKESTYFTNLYSPSITTYESVPSILTGKKPFDNSIKEKITVEDNECEFIKEAERLGYKIKIYSNHWNIIDGKQIEYFDGNYATLTIWNAICDLLKNTTNNNIYILYFWQETHPPHLCGKHMNKPVPHLAPFSGNLSENQEQSLYTKQYNECLKYADEVMKYYFDILGKDMLKIIFSDHGQVVEQAMDDLNTIGTLAGWHQDRVHVPLIINGSYIKEKSFNGLNSLVNFNQIMKCILKQQQIDIKSAEFIEYDFSKMENDIIIKKYLEAGLEDYLYGFRAFVNGKYKCIKTGNNKLKFYDIKDNEIINEEKILNLKELFKEKIDEN